MRPLTAFPMIPGFPHAVNYAPIGAVPGSTTPVSTVEELLKENASFHGIGT